MEGQEISLADVLAFREWKASIQDEMLQKRPDKVVVSIAMNIPGPIKTNALIQEAFEEGMAALEGMFEKQEVQMIQKVQLEQEAGNTAIYAVDKASGNAIKQEAVILEEGHPLGRIFDIDVIEKNGSIPRQAVGKPERKCLICGESAKACGRNRTHTVKELQRQVVKIMNDWKAGKSL